MGVAFKVFWVCVILLALCIWYAAYDVFVREPREEVEYERMRKQWTKDSKKD